MGVAVPAVVGVTVGGGTVADGVAEAVGLVITVGDAVASGLRTICPSAATGDRFPAASVVRAATYAVPGVTGSVAWSRSLLALIRPASEGASNMRKTVAASNSAAVAIGWAAYRTSIRGDPPQYRSSPGVASSVSVTAPVAPPLRVAVCGTIDAEGRASVA